MKVCSRISMNHLNSEFEINSGDNAWCGLAQCFVKISVFNYSILLHITYIFFITSHSFANCSQVLSFKCYSESFLGSLYDPSLDNDDAEIDAIVAILATKCKE